jgi:cardiolipin synthase
MRRQPILAVWRSSFCCCLPWRAAVCPLGALGSDQSDQPPYPQIFESRGRWLKNNPDCLQHLSETYPQRRRLAVYLENQGFPLYEGTQCSYFPLGELQFTELVADLKAAQSFIFLEFFIISSGRLWEQIHMILRQKVSEGVEVRLLYDDFGSIVTMPDRFRED